MKKFLIVGGMVLPAFAQSAEKPNIIYIMTDQQTATAMSCMGNKDLHTPNMDRLAFYTSKRTFKGIYVYRTFCP